MKRRTWRELKMKKMKISRRTMKARLLMTRGHKSLSILEITKAECPLNNTMAL